MRGACVIAAAALGSVISTAPAVACTVLLPAPRAGETLAQVAFRQERLEQQQLRRQATSVYLARVRSSARGPYFRPVLSIEGGRPPGRADAKPRTTCEPSEPAVGELRIVFSRTVGLSDTWRPWRWGSHFVVGSRRPSEVADPDLARVLRQAAARIARD